MRVLFSVVLGAVFGLAIGVGVASHVWITSHVSLLDGVALANYEHEQAVLRDAALAKGNVHEAAVHQLVVADTSSGTGFHWAEQWAAQPYWDLFKEPWGAYWLIREHRAMSDEALEGQAEGALILEALRRSEAAHLLEAAGAKAAAEKQLDLAEGLHPKWTRENLRRWGQEQVRIEAADCPHLRDAYFAGRTFRERLELEAAAIEDYHACKSRVQAASRK